MKLYHPLSGAVGASIQTARDRIWGFGWGVELPGITSNNTGWWYTYPSEKYEFVSWDDEIPDIWTKNNVPNHQPE